MLMRTAAERINSSAGVKAFISIASRRGKTGRTERSDHAAGKDKECMTHNKSPTSSQHLEDGCSSSAIFLQPADRNAFGKGPSGFLSPSLHEPA